MRKCVTFVESLERGYGDALFRLDEKANKLSGGPINVKDYIGPSLGGSGGFSDVGPALIRIVVYENS